MDDFSRMDRRKTREKRCTTLSLPPAPSGSPSLPHDFSAATNGKKLEKRPTKTLTHFSTPKCAPASHKAPFQKKRKKCNKHPFPRQNTLKHPEESPAKGVQLTKAPTSPESAISSSIPSGNEQGQAGNLETNAQPLPSASDLMSSKSELVVKGKDKEEV